MPFSILQQEDKSDDLIKLDSKPLTLEDFDPLLSKDRTPKEEQMPVFTRGLTNPVYSFFGPSGTSLVNGNTKTNTYDSSRNDQDLLQEYGLDFNNFSINMSSSNATTSNTCEPFSVKKQSQWTTFE